jgi:hypothetical protein
MAVAGLVRDGAPLPDAIGYAALQKLLLTYA